MTFYCERVTDTPGLLGVVVFWLGWVDWEDRDGDWDLDKMPNGS